jgi:uncharacterized membrane protein HdeD (DUF308 family)
MEEFLMGAISMASAVAALFFLRFWRETRDRLFAIFAAAFFLLGCTRLGLAFSIEQTEGHTHWYWLRLLAFLLILIAIADKNRRPLRESIDVRHG